MTRLRFDALNRLFSPNEHAKNLHEGRVIKTLGVEGQAKEILVIAAAAAD